ncbi:hypothetical protein O181_032895 [Austropuccinia psidii MF-1]|uniref:Uncharacterized protein n=1 Tax=Austropuccinia psidii MF-1 TaxID=1389203 RepID=A0A9Q3H8N7_9BASI|nr:hypothetical protein [Austropuccinia psidii MF-1]
MMVWGASCGLIQSQLLIIPTGQQQAIYFIENAYEPGLLPFMDKLVEVDIAENCKRLTLMEDGGPSILPLPANNGRTNIKFTSLCGLLPHLISTQSKTYGLNKICCHSPFQSQNNGPIDSSSQCCLGIITL